MCSELPALLGWHAPLLCCCVSLSQYCRGRETTVPVCWLMECRDGLAVHNTLLLRQTSHVELGLQLLFGL